MTWLWTYIWGQANYSSHKSYKFIHKTIQSTIVFKWIWKSKYVSKLKVFPWLLLRNWLNTKSMLRRPHYYSGSNRTCVLCQSSADETILHLFFTCRFSKLCWQRLGIQWSNSLDTVDLLTHARRNFGNDFFMEIFIIVAWHIWKQRNREKNLSKESLNCKEETTFY